MKRVALAVLSMTIATSANAQTLTPVGGNGVDLRYENGRAVAISRKETSGVLLVARGGAFSGNGPQAFDLLVANQSPQPINLIPSSVSVRTQVGEILPLMSAEDVRKETRRAASRSTFGMRLGAALVAGASSSEGQGTVTGSSNSYGALGNQQFSSNSNYQATYTDPTAAALAGAENNRQAAIAGQRIARAQQEVISTALPMTFNAQTIDSGKSYLTPFSVAKLGRKVSAIEVTVSVGQDLHRFSFTVSR
jgi:hypothetical protein